MVFKSILILFCLYCSVNADDITAKRWFGLPQVSSIIKKIIKYNNATEVPIELVTVQTSLDLCKDEKTFIANRMVTVEQTLKKEFGVKNPLKIAFCCGGGGNRAMIGTLGLLSGAAQSKILDASLYIAGLSGSTWSIVPFFCMQAKRHQNDTDALSYLYKYLQKTLPKNSRICVDDICTPSPLPMNLSDDFFVEIALRYGYDQPLTLVNLFGPLVANYAMGIFGKNRLNITWSSLASEAKNGKMPLPLCSSIYQKEDGGYGWFEMSPFQAGSKDIGYIPVKYLGSKFTQGVLDSNNICPEYPLSFYLGMYGSAFAATVQELDDMQKRLKQKTFMVDSLFEANIQTDEYDASNKSMLNSSFLRNHLKQWIEEMTIERNPITFAQFDHYSACFAADSKEKLGLFDAGIDFNSPLPLLLDRPERKVDIIIMYDSHPGDGQTVQKAFAYAKKSGIIISSEALEITTKQLNEKIMTVFNDPRAKSYNINAPTIIYFPTKDIDIEFAPYITFNFKYLPEQTKLLMEKTHQAFMVSVDEIKSIMQAIDHYRVC